MLKFRACLVCLGLALSTAGRAQLIPLLPPVPTESTDEPTPQQNKTVQLIQDDLVAERFDDLDQMANRFRQKKSRVAGGGWRLRSFYSALDEKQLSDEATQEHMDHIAHWIAAKPESITARVAMAQSLHRWAWFSRGSGLASTVTDSMAKLFFERIAKEQQVLEAAARLRTMCPQWYSEMMTVGLAQGWDHDKMQALFDKATAFEPGYLYFYREYANYLLPKWEGHPGDATDFAKTTADRVGGDPGDLIYFEVATIVIKRGNGGIPTSQMDWERIKRGAKVLDREFGQSKTTTNQLAFMAYKYRDATVAAPLFASIGDRWGTGVWGARANFDNARRWAERAANAQPPELVPRQ